MNLSTKFCRIVALGLLGVLVPSTASATLVALSENDSTKGLIKSTDGLVPEATTYVGELDSGFHGMTAADMVMSATDDMTSVISGSGTNVGSNAHLGGNGTSNVMIKFDLSSIPANATINKAQLQFWGHSGNQKLRGNTNGIDSTFGVITTHNWSEGTASPNNPAGGGTQGWGPGADATFSIGAGGDVPVTTPFDLTQNGDNTKVNFLNDEPGPKFSFFLTQEVTGSLQDFVDGSVPNYGWGYFAKNYVFSSSENAETISKAGSQNFGTETKPILFVDYTVAAVPEPSSFLMFSALALGFGMIRKRS